MGPSPLHGVLMSRFSGCGQLSFVSTTLRHPDMVRARRNAIASMSGSAIPQRLQRKPHSASILLLTISTSRYYVRATTGAATRGCLGTVGLPVR